MSNPSSSLRSLHTSTLPNSKQSSPSKSQQQLPALTLRLEQSPPIARRYRKTSTLVERRGVHLSVRTDRPDYNPHTLFTNKPAAEIMQELKLLESRGFKTDVGEAHLFDIFGEQTESPRKSGLSVIDLWGPNYTRKSLIASGMYEAYKTMESRDKRHSIAKEPALSAKFLPRLVEDISTMRMLSTQKTKMHFSQLDSAPTSPMKVPVSSRVKGLDDLMSTCTRLSLDNQTFMKKLLRTQLRLKRKSRKVHSDL